MPKRKLIEKICTKCNEKYLGYETTKSGVDHCKKCQNNRPKKQTKEYYREYYDTVRRDRDKRQKQENKKQEKRQEYYKILEEIK